MFIDYHTHHVRCGHATGKLEEYVQRGIEIGLEQLGLSDHMPLIHVDPANYYPGMAMAYDELPSYVEECLFLKEKYKGQIELKMGLEADYIEGYEEEIGHIVHGYPWDYVIGSVHFLGTWDISDSRQLDGWKGRDPDEVYRLYYEAVKKAANTGFYDYSGHVDVIKRFGFLPNSSVDSLEKAALDVIKHQDMAIELNTSGLKSPAAEMFPSRSILEYCFQKKIPLTYGSDAHQPKRLAQYYEEAVALLKEIGFTQLATFNQRQRIMVDM